MKKPKKVIAKKKKNKWLVEPEEVDEPIVIAKPSKERLSKFEIRREDEWSIDTWKYDLTKSKNGPISVEVEWKKILPCHEKMVSKAALKKQKKQELKEYQERVAQNNQ
jgi:hypothetical protein